MATTRILNIQVFDGTDFIGPKDVTIQGDLIESITASDGVHAVYGNQYQVVDGTGKFLVPGFIDCHVHVRARDQLLAHARHGVTTVLDMGNWPVELTNSLRNQKGCADFLSAGLQAFAHDSPRINVPLFADQKPVATMNDAEDFVQARVDDGSDFIKVIMEGTFDRATLQTLTGYARQAGKLSVAHCTNVASFRQAFENFVDILTHAPVDAPLPRGLAEVMAKSAIICVPTLVMMNAVMSKRKPGADVNAIASVKMMREAGIPILVGTDANEGGGAPAEVLHGASFRVELILLSMSGMSLLEILRATSVDAAKHFKLSNRGTIEPGKRADLVLLGSDPLKDLAAYGRVQKVYCRGELVH